MSDRVSKGLIIVLSVAGVLTVLYATAPWGVGIAPDSHNFVEAGSMLLAGRGYRLATGQPLAYWPPLFPALIALPGLAHVDPYVAARWSNALAFGGTHYPQKFNKVLLEGEYALSAVVAKHYLEWIDGEIFGQLIQKTSKFPRYVLVDWKGAGPHREKIISLSKQFALEVVRV